MGIKLRSLRFSNYLGVGPEPVALEFHPRCTVFCGPNNSGKTTMLSAISLLAETMRASSWVQVGPGFQISNTTASVSQEVFNFRSRASESIFESEIDVDRRLLSFSVDGDQTKPVQLALRIALAPGQKTLHHMTINSDPPVFAPKTRTDFFEPQPNGIYYTQRDNRGAAILDLPKLLADRTAFFPSARNVGVEQGSSTDDIAQLARGSGITSWVLNSMNPNPREGASVKRHELLKAFESEFGNFAGFSPCSLSVGGNELNVHIDGHPIPISRLGAGVAECLIMMLVCKLARELAQILQRPPIEILLIEEPELHLHPRLQRLFLGYLLQYAEANDVQLILSTHSATVLNAVYSVGTVHRTRFDDERRQVRVRSVAATDQLLALLKDIGASPGDVLQADKVLWVEGPHDIPVFQAWKSKAPSFQNQTVAVLSLGGDDPASDAFDINQLVTLNPNCLVVLDSERTGPSGSPKAARLTTQGKCQQAGITCLLTDRRATENYFTSRALASIYPNVPPQIDPYAKLTNYIPSFSKDNNGMIAAAMDWSDLSSTDVGEAIEGFLKR
jgi:hypothetical protein